VIKRFLLPAALAVVLVTGTGCTDTASVFPTDTADFFPMNTAAQHLGPVHASFVRTGVGRGPVTITMADGEVLTGEYRVAFASGIGTSFTTATAFTPVGLASGSAVGSTLMIGDGPVQFVMRGPKTQMLCRGNSTTMGHGSGQCQTFEGAVWAISW
jgi:hypothetical protein